MLFYYRRPKLQTTFLSIHYVENILYESKQASTSRAFKLVGDGRTGIPEVTYLWMLKFNTVITVYIQKPYVERDRRYVCKHPQQGSYIKFLYINKEMKNCKLSG